MLIGSVNPPSFNPVCLFSDGGGEQRAAGVEGVQFWAGAGLAQPAAALLLPPARAPKPLHRRRPGVRQEVSQLHGQVALHLYERHYGAAESCRCEELQVFITFCL